MIGFVVAWLAGVWLLIVIAPGRIGHAPVDRRAMADLEDGGARRLRDGRIVAHGGYRVENPETVCEVP